jgi:uncharacterized membrane protein
MHVASHRKISAAAIVVLFALQALPLPALLAAAAPSPLLVAGDVPWGQFGVTPGHSFTYTGSERGFHDVLTKWRLGASPGGGSSIANFSANIALANTTSKPDVLGVVLDEAGAVVIAAGNNGTTMWSFPVFGSLFATPVVADVNGDGKLDVVIRDGGGLVEALTPAITWDGASYTFPVSNVTELQAEQLWNFTLTGVASSNNNLSTPMAADIQGGASAELLIPIGDTLYLLNGADGNQLRNQSVEGTIVGAPAVYRVSGTSQVVVGSVNVTGVNSSLYTVTAFDASLNFLWARNFTQYYDLALAKSLDLQLPSPATGDLDGSGLSDDVALVTPYEDSLARLRVYSNGSNAFSTNVSLQGLAGSSPAISDLDGDGTQEVVALSYEPGRPLSTNSRVFVEVFNKDGTRRWNATVDEIAGFPREHVLAPPAIADFDNDGVRDIVVYLTDGWSEVRSGLDGSRLLRHQLLDQPTATEFSGPAIADVDKDGFLDITANGATVSYGLAELHPNATQVVFVPAAPQEFENVTVSATIHNTGNTAARNVTVEFREGTKKLNETVLPLILPTTTSQAQAVVNFSGGGTRTLTIEVDPNDTVEEIDEGNNFVSVTINVTSLYGFHLESPLNRTVVQPGFSYAFILNAVSEGTANTTVDLSYSGLPSGWSASLTPARVDLTPAGTPGDTNSSFFSVSTPGVANPGEYDLTVMGLATADSRDSANITFTVIIGGQFGVSMYPKSAEGNATAGDLVPYTFTVVNSGNSNDTIQFQVGGTPPGWSALSSRASVTLGPGQTTTVILQVRAPANATSGENATISLTARSVGDPAKNATVSSLTTVVLPDLVVTDIQFFRECGGEATTGAPHLVTVDDSIISVKVTNAAGNAPISNVGMIVWVDGTPYSGAVAVPAAGVGTFNVSHRFSSSGVKVVTAEADPNGQISEISESNNALNEQTTVKDASPVGDLTVQGWVLENGTGSPFASVRVSDPRSGANLSTTTGGNGFFVTTLRIADYLDGDTIMINASDGLDVGTATGCAYSEDAALNLNVSLGLPSPYDFLLAPAGPTDLEAPPGTSATFEVDILNRGALNNTILLSSSGLWQRRILDANGTPTSVVVVGPHGTLRIRVEVTPPGALNPGDWNVTELNATAAADSSRTRWLWLNTSVGIIRQVGINGPNQASGFNGDEIFLNLTVSNGGNVDETIQLGLLDANASGVVATAAGRPVDGYNISVVRAGTAVVEVRLVIPTTSTGGNFALNFTATSASNGSLTAAHLVTLNVTVRRYEFSLTGATTIRISPGAAKTTTLGIANLGTIPDTYDVLASQAPAGFSVRMLAGTSPASVFSADPGTSATVTIEITTPREVSLESFDIDLVVTSRGGAPERSFTLTALIGNVYDFRITGPTFSTPPTVDAETQVFAAVDNVGARAFVGSLQVRLLVSGTVVSTQTISSLAVGARSTVAFAWTPRVAGPVNVTVDVNLQPNSAIFESSLSNNMASGTATVVPPQPSDIFSSPGTYLLIIVLLAIAVGVAATVRRREDVQKQQDVEQAAEESEVRRRGGGPGGLERL